MKLRGWTGLLLTGGLLLVGCGKKGPPAFDGDAYKKDKQAFAKEYVKAEHTKMAQKQPKKCFVPVFQVEFINQSSASSSSYNLGSSNSSSVNLTYKLQGVDTANFTALVDSLYADFTANLKAAGYEVVDKAAMLQAPQYQEFKSKTEKLNPIEKNSRLGGGNKALVVAPTDMAVAYFMTLNPAPSLKSMWAGIKGDLPEAPIAHFVDSAKAVAVCAQMVVGFAQLKDTHVKGSGNSQVSSEFRFSLANVHTLLAFAGEESVAKAGNPNRWNIVPKGPVMRLNKPMFGSNGFATGTRDITSTGAKVVEGLANAFSMLAASSNGGSSHSSKTRVYALDVDKDKYLAMSRENLGYATDMLLVSMQAGQ